MIIKSRTHYIFVAGTAVAAFFAGYPLAFVVAIILTSNVTAENCPPPCDGPAMALGIVTTFLGPVFGLILGVLDVWWLNRFLKKRRSESTTVNNLP